MIIALALFAIVGVGCMTAVALLSDRQKETPHQREADRLLTELWIIEQLLPGLPAEFRAKLARYININNQKEVTK